MITNNIITSIQQMYFDVTDLLHGESFKSLGYDDQKDFLQELQSKLEDLEYSLTHH